MRSRRPCSLVSRPARARRIPAAVAVRGLVPVPGPRAGRARTDARSRGGRVQGAPPLSGALTRLQELLQEQGGLMVGLLAGQRTRPAIVGAEPSVRAGPPGRPWAPHTGASGRVRTAGRGDLRGLPAALRRSPPVATPATPTWGCSPATACTRSASTGWSRSGPSRAWATRRRDHPGGARPRHGRRASSPQRSGPRARGRSAGARASSTSGPRPWPEPGPQALAAMRASAGLARP